MTHDGRVPGCDGGAVRGEIPAASAGMTELGAGVTEGGVGVADLGRGCDGVGAWVWRRGDVGVTGEEGRK